LRYLPGRGQGSPGHASIQIGNTYVSFWPGTSSGVLEWQGHRTHTLDEDIQHYRQANQTHLQENVPNNEGGPGLDEEAMRKRWKEIDLANPDYTRTFQCAAVVNELLIAGGSRNFVKNTFWEWTSWYIYAASPRNVKEYTITLVLEIQKARQQRK
jgi:hypothetical protein